MVQHKMAAGRHAWVQVPTGTVSVNGQTLGPGDGAALTDESQIEIKAVESSELLLFDLA